MLEYCEATFSPEVLQQDSSVLKKCHAIAARITGIPVAETYSISQNSLDQETSEISEERQLERLWGPGQIRVFISHVHQFKGFAKAIQGALEVFGIASFVAHIDIEPSQEWQVDIVRALRSMDMFIALLTVGFKESDWTDQEVGYAVAREVPILPIDQGKIPYGFMAKYQAMKWVGSSAFPVARTIFQMALKNDKLISSAKESFVASISGAKTWAQAKELSFLLSDIESLSPHQAESLLRAYNSNSEVYREFRFKRVITSQLSRITGSTYNLDTYGRLHQLRDTEEVEEIPF